MTRKKGETKKNTPHDGLIKKVMENPIAAREFLEEYVPESFKSRIGVNHFLCVSSKIYAPINLV